MPMYFLLGFFLSMITSYVIVSDMETKNKTFFYIAVLLIVAIVVLITVTNKG